MNIDFNSSINVFTDASITNVNGKSVSCSGYVIVCNNQIIDAKYRIFYDSSNNYGEIYALYMGVYAAIEFAYKTGYAYRINVLSDSQISIYGLRDWIFAWYKKLDGEYIMVSSNGIPVSNQFIFKRIVKTIIYSKLPIHFYHQLGHMNNVSKDIEKVITSFKKVNKESINDDIAEKIIYYNNFVDRFTRNNLLSVTKSLVFDINNYKKEIEVINEILTDDDMNTYGLLINKTRAAG